MLGVPTEDPSSSLQSMLSSQHPFVSFPIGTSQILQQETRVSFIHVYKEKFKKNNNKNLDIEMLCVCM